MTADLGVLEPLASLDDPAAPFAPNRTYKIDGMPMPVLPPQLPINYEGRFGGVRLNGLQYIRAGAALGVVAFHAAPASGHNFHFGAFGVDLFFVLSGFLMVSITDGGSRPLPFLRDRVTRIVPLYWTALIVTVIAQRGGFPAWPATAANVVTALAFLPRPEGDGPYFAPILDVGWTLNFEMFFYLVFALTLTIAKNYRLAVCTAIFLGLYAMRLSFTPQGPIGFWTNPVIFEFLAGAWAGVLWKRRLRAPSRRGWILVAASGVVLVCVMAVAHALSQHAYAIDRALLSIPAILLLWGVLKLEGSSGRIAHWRLPAFLGDASFSIYLFHKFGLAGAAALAARLELPGTATFLLCVAAGVAVGALAYVSLERPLLKAFHRRTPMFSKAVPPVAKAS